jgi:3-deoxy-D-manno-octulosonic-acid transferase
VHPLLALPYAAVGALAEALAAAGLPAGDGKLARTFAARRDGARALVDWGRTGRDATRPLLWMHAPSVGEGLMARPVLDAARAGAPQVQRAYTWFSPSAERFAAGLDVDVRAPLPFDTARAARTVLDALRPSALVVARSDVWPVLTAAAHARGVGTALVSAALPAGSQRSAWARWALADAYAALDAVGAVSEEDAERLVALGVARTRVHVTGDTRYDQVLARAALADRAGPLLAPLAAGAAERPWVVAGSTWPADEGALLPAWARLARAGAGPRLLIAPHEPTPAHLDPIVAWARGAGLRLERVGSAAQGEADVVLVDRVGVLGDLYAIAAIAVVGGGFHDQGLHSVVEPASFGVPVLVGPRHGRSRDAARLIAAGGAVAVADGAALERQLAAWLADAPAARAAGAAALGVVEAGRGAAARSWALVAPLLGVAGA